MNATLVLSIGETVEEVTDSCFLGTTPTLSCAALSDDALVQVRYDGITFLRAWPDLLCGIWQNRYMARPRALHAHSPSGYSELPIRSPKHATHNFLQIKFGNSLNS